MKRKKRRVFSEYKDSYFFINEIKMLSIGLFSLFGLIGTIESCPGWKLNDYPEIKGFLKGKNGINLYPQISVKWINGHNPDLVIDNQRIDLTQYKSKEEIHLMLQSRGFVNISPRFQYPRDKNENCKKWAEQKECMTNSMYMNEYCPFSCHIHKTEL